MPSFPDLRQFPLPGTANLYVLDRVQILEATLPLESPIEYGMELDIEKRKEPGSDYSSYVSHGIDATPIRISLKLFRDLSSGKDWINEYLKIKDRLISRFRALRNAVPVYHPFLDLYGINSVVFVKDSGIRHTRGHFFSVTLEGFNPKALRIGSGGASKKVEQDKGLAKLDPAKQKPANVRTPGQNQVGKARYSTSS